MKKLIYLIILAGIATPIVIGLANSDPQEARERRIREQQKGRPEPQKKEPRESRSDQNKSSNRDAWYVGGNLHEKTVGEWRMATAKNKLATAADWCASFDNSVGMEKLKIRAAQMVVCVDTAVQDGLVDSLGVSEIAAACTLLLEDQGW